MKPEHLKLMQKMIEKSIKETVNGKIAELREIQANHARDDLIYQEKDLAFKETIMKHMEDTRPYMEGIAGLGLISKVFMGLGSIAVGYVAIKSIFHL